eukprot:Gregarina_sp_Poly_1__3588@NODE_204_length_11513_cov_91_076009_g182_i0_p3_GENE_NODE_204_length_11513_cov_91_076009_g182_i0NODE_204_length_11513_cov_91_076009_g182_i0_p3_ORF_typecomplete_len268_score40_47_NODE_204_length_11513_cov_91_076009_g182_i050055808
MPERKSADRSAAPLESAGVSSTRRPGPGVLDQFLAVWEACGRRYRFTLSDGELVDVQLLPRSFVSNPAAVEELGYLSERCVSEPQGLRRFVALFETLTQCRIRSSETRGNEPFRLAAALHFNHVLFGPSLVGAPVIPTGEVADTQSFASSVSIDTSPEDEEDSLFDHDDIWGQHPGARPLTARPTRSSPLKLSSSVCSRVQALPPGLNKDSKAASNDELLPRSGGSTKSVNKSVLSTLPCSFPASQGVPIMKCPKHILCYAPFQKML